MAGKRKYDDSCAVAHGLDLIGGRWALLIVRELLLGPKRFTDLRAGVPGASADMLTQRLRDLCTSGIIQRRKLPPPAGSWVYELTDWGAELEPVVTQLSRWSSRSPTLRKDGELGTDSLALSLGALFDPRAAQGLVATFALRLGEDRFCVQIAEGRLTLERGEPDQADAVIDTDPRTLSALLWQDLPLADALHTGALTVDGPQCLAERFTRLFPLPEPATMAL
jgi:DNA-binding HxlR family transcriptional regulator/putative sterol carrier protein